MPILVERNGHYVDITAETVERLWTRIESRQRADEAWRNDPERFYELPVRPTWNDIAAHRPEINALIPLARRGCFADKTSYVFWSRHIKPQIVQLVGWEADVPPPLRTSIVYDVVYARLLGIYEGRVSA